jgi:hypothetical protein
MTISVTLASTLDFLATVFMSIKTEDDNSTLALR